MALLDKNFPAFALTLIQGPNMTEQPRLIAGVDGCKAGWICVAFLADGEFSAFIEPSIASLVQGLPAGTQIAVDVPIGLSTDESRRCDTEARAFVGPRRSSVFPTPIRAVLGAASRESADQAQRKRHRRGIGIGVQTFAIVPKIREVDSFLQSGLMTRSELIEVHPEVSFTLWHNGHLSHSKKKPEGRTLREALIAEKWPTLRIEALHQLRSHSSQQYGSDDLNDAFAALWTAERYSDGLARSFPAVEYAETDVVIGRRMHIFG